MGKKTENEESYVPGKEIKGKNEALLGKILVFIFSVTFVCQIIDFPKYMWINLTVFSLLNPLAENTSKRKYAHIPATVIGCIIFFAVFEYIIPAKNMGTVLLLAGFISTFMTSYFSKTVYNSFSALSSAILIFPTTSAVLIRITANIIGVIVSVISIFVFDIIFKNIGRKSGNNECLEKY